MDFGDADCDYMIKLILIGNSCVGKTSLIHRLNEPDKPMLETNATIGYEFCNKYFEQGDKLIQVHLWDTAGQEKHSCMVATYYRKTAGAIIVYDITDYSSFSSLNKWFAELKNNNEDGCKVVIVGNKCDLEKNRAVSFEEGQEFAKQNDSLFFETSAKTGDNVQNVFDSLITTIVDALKQLESDGQNDCK